MSGVDWTAISGLGISVATAAGAIYTARAGRRTRGQERRADFDSITARLDKDVEKLTTRLDGAEAEVEEQRARLAGQESTIRYLVGWVRSLVVAVRAAGAEPPPAPQPVPEELRPYLTDIGV